MDLGHLYVMAPSEKGSIFTLSALTPKRPHSQTPPSYVRYGEKRALRRLLPES